MKRTNLIAMTAAAFIAAPAAFAETPAASTGTGTEVASTQFSYDTNSPRINNGMAEFDSQSIAMSTETFRTLANARGDSIETTTGEMIGKIENINVNAQGNPEIVVDLEDESEIPADVLVITVQPGNLMMQDGKLFLMTSVDELQLKAKKNAVADSNDRVTVTLF